MNCIVHAFMDDTAKLCILSCQISVDTSYRQYMLFVHSYCVGAKLKISVGLIHENLNFGYTAK